MSYGCPSVWPEANLLKYDSLTLLNNKPCIPLNTISREPIVRQLCNLYTCVLKVCLNINHVDFYFSDTAGIRHKDLFLYFKDVSELK